MVTDKVPAISDESDEEINVHDDESDDESSYNQRNKSNSGNIAVGMNNNEMTTNKNSSNINNNTSNSISV